MWPWGKRALYVIGAAVVGAVGALALDWGPTWLRPRFELKVPEEQPLDGMMVIEIRNRGFIPVELAELELGVFIQQAYQGRRNENLKLIPRAGRIRLDPGQQSMVLLEPKTRSSSSLIDTLYDPGWAYPQSLGAFVELTRTWESRCVVEVFARESHAKNLSAPGLLVPCTRVWPIVYAFVEKPT